jgi:putative transposase
MSRRVNFQLNDEQFAEIEQAINHAVQPEVRQRAIAIRLLHLGHKPEAVAQVVLVSANTVWVWHRRYRQAGLAGLQDQPRSGRPNKADADYIAQLEHLLDTDPRTLGLPFTIWTINRLRLYLAEQTHILLSYTRFRALLSRLNYRWKQSKHDLLILA